MLDFVPNVTRKGKQITITLRPEEGGDTYYLRSFPLANTGSDRDAAVNKKIEAKVEKVLDQIYDLILDEEQHSADDIMALKFEAMSYAEGKKQREIDRIMTIKDFSA